MTTPVQRVLRLLEAKSFKNKIPKQTKDRLQDILARLHSYDSEVMKDYGIRHVNDIIEFVEYHFRQVNYQVLSKYVPWVIDILSYSRPPVISLYVDTRGEAVISSLMTYDRLVRKRYLTGTRANIFTFADFKELDEFLDTVEDPDKREELLKSGQAEMFYESDDVWIVKINSHQAAKYFGSGTRGRSTPWCLHDRQHYSDYAKKRYDWYFLLDHKKGKRFAIDKTYGLVWDIHNVVYNLEKLIKEYPIVKRVTSFSLALLLVRIYDDTMKLIKESYPGFSDREYEVCLAAEPITIGYPEVLISLDKYATVFEKEERLYGFVESFSSQIAYRHKCSVTLSDERYEIHAVFKYRGKR